MMIGVLLLVRGVVVLVLVPSTWATAAPLSMYNARIRRGFASGGSDPRRRGWPVGAPFGVRWIRWSGCQAGRDLAAVGSWDPVGGRLRARRAMSMGMYCDHPGGYNMTIVLGPIFISQAFQNKNNSKTTPAGHLSQPAVLKSSQNPNTYAFLNLQTRPNFSHCMHLG